MNILFILVPVALILAGIAVAGFIWAVRHGQYEDVHTPAIRMLLDDQSEDDQSEDDQSENDQSEVETGESNTDEEKPAPSVP